MTPKRTDASADLFGFSLVQLINLDHPLVRLSYEFDWEGIRREIEPSFCDANGRAVADVRVVVGLFYLKSAFNLSDEQLLARWVENPYWQWFSGFETMQHKPPNHTTTLSRWRSRLGADKLEVAAQADY
jgi:IS5 family transposase